MNIKDFRKIVRTVLEDMAQHSISTWAKNIEDMIVGTALHESAGLKYNRQLGGGPALSYFQIEPVTHKDLWKNYIVYHKKIVDYLKFKFDVDEDSFTHDMLVSNLEYSLVICRIIYLRKPGVIPSTLNDQAHYWKQYYNTYLGKGTEEEYVNDYNRYNEEI